MHTSAFHALQRCPAPHKQRIVLRISASAEQMLRHGHPWLYDQAIRQQSRDGQPGDLAVVFDRKRRFLAIGLYDPTSPIRVRVLQHHKPAPIDHAWYERRLMTASSRRTVLAESSTTGYRLVHGENDGLPGLVIDRYERTLVVKLYTVAWVAHLRSLVPALLNVCRAERLVLRLSRSVQRDSPLLHELRDGMIVDGAAFDTPLVFRENGLRFEADPIHGQKTGFFLDQRDNRTRLELLTVGRSVLDAFAYTGAFSVYAARGKARKVTSVDISRPALAATQRNMQLNRNDPAVRAVVHQVVSGDTFELLERWHKDRRRFGAVVLDPPSFAKTREEVRRALIAYGRLTRLGLNVLEPDGILAYACCSGQVSAELFFDTVHRAATSIGRPLKEIARTLHPIDHPTSFAEGAYLKCLFAIAPNARRTIHR